MLWAGLQMYGGPGSLSHDSKIPRQWVQWTHPLKLRKNLTLIKNIHLTASLLTQHVCCQYSKTCL